MYKKLLKRFSPALILASALLFAFILSRFYSIAFVYGGSMEPFYHDKDAVVLDRTVKNSKELCAGDVIIFRNSKISPYPIIKRIAALPHDTVEIKNGRLLVNGTPSPVAKEVIFDKDMEILTLDESSVFVIGDNTSASVDSRDPSFGPISLCDIMGKVIFKLF